MCLAEVRERSQEGARNGLLGRKPICNQWDGRLRLRLRQSPPRQFPHVRLSHRLVWA